MVRRTASQSFGDSLAWPPKAYDLFRQAQTMVPLQLADLGSSHWWQDTEQSAAPTGPYHEPGSPVATQQRF